MEDRHTGRHGGVNGSISATSLRKRHLQEIIRGLDITVKFIRFSFLYNVLTKWLKWTSFFGGRDRLSIRPSFRFLSKATKRISKKFGNVGLH
jgi:hypothetical protein